MRSHPTPSALGSAIEACLGEAPGDAASACDEAPSPSHRAGTVTALAEIAPDVVELVVALSRPLAYRPGQHVSLAFAGFPARDYCPTLRLDGSAELNELVFQIRRDPTGLVSSQIGARIRPGHLVRVRGPHGAAFHRRGGGRLVLVATGAGFAPIWAVARAARYTEPEREMVVVVGARRAESLTMRPAIAWLQGSGVVQAVLACSRPGEGILAPDLRAGRVTRHLPRLEASDTVYAAGHPGMVAAVELLAAGAGAACHPNPFTPSARGTRQRGFMDLLRRRFLPLAEPLAEPLADPLAEPVPQASMRGGAPGE